MRALYSNYFLSIFTYNLLFKSSSVTVTLLFSWDGGGGISTEITTPKVDGVAKLLCSRFKIEISLHYYIKYNIIYCTPKATA